MPFLKKIPFFFFVSFVILISLFHSSCGVYSFADVSIPDSIKTIRIQFLENRAPYVNPRLSPALTERVKQKIINQTRLSQTNGDEAHYDVSGYISDYSVATSGVSERQEVMNRLTVSVHITLNNRLTSEPQEFDISRSFQFSATQSLQAAEAQLLDEIIRSLTDDIFNRLFSNW